MADASLQLCDLPDSLLLEILSFLLATELGSVSQTCSRLFRIVRDELLWKNLFYRHFKVPSSVPMHPKGMSWRREFKRLQDESPALLCEEIKKHKDQVLHVSFSHNGQMFATSSKDGKIMVWNSEHPCTLRFQANMTKDFSWRYTQFSQFNKTDTSLLVSGVHYGNMTTSGEIAVFDLQDFEPQCRVVNKPYDVFGTWYDNQHLLSGTLYWTGNLNSISALWLNKASQAVESERESVMMCLYRFQNVNASSIRTVMVADCPIPQSAQSADICQKCCKPKSARFALGSGSVQVAFSDLSDDNANNNNVYGGYSKTCDADSDRLHFQKCALNSSAVDSCKASSQRGHHRQEACGMHWAGNDDDITMDAADCCSCREVEGNSVGRDNIEADIFVRDEIEADFSVRDKLETDFSDGSKIEPPSSSHLCSAISEEMAPHKLMNEVKSAVEDTARCAVEDPVGWLATGAVTQGRSRCPVHSPPPSKFPRTQSSTSQEKPGDRACASSVDTNFCRCNPVNDSGVSSMLTVRTGSCGTSQNASSMSVASVSLGKIQQRVTASIESTTSETASSSSEAHQNVSSAKSRVIQSPPSPIPPPLSSSSSQSQPSKLIASVPSISGCSNSKRTDLTEKLLIFTMGEETYTPHLIGIKRMRLQDVLGSRAESEVVNPNGEVQLLPNVDENMHGMDRPKDEVDHVINMRGHIVGMALSPDHRYLYVNSRQWPQNYSIEKVLEPPPIAQEIDIHVIDLQTFQEVGTIMRSHRAFTPNDECFFLFLDISNLYVASGAEDKHGYIWDRHYGGCLNRFPHNDVVNSVAFNPKDEEMLITVSDDFKIKVWRSRRQMRKLGLSMSMDASQQS